MKLNPLAWRALANTQAKTKLMQMKTPRTSPEVALKIKATKGSAARRNRYHDN